MGRFELISMHGPPGIKKFKGEDFVVDIVIDEHVSEIIRKKIEKIDCDNEERAEAECVAEPAGYFIGIPGDTGYPPVLYWIIS